ncbi:hypothetical protein, partial [Klebsiella pneumoniae]|uniref:hypothetical protein n=1 Tax=Klebsiella pneumoniae TaxID=573 RepID=UPI001C200987
ASAIASLSSSSRNNFSMPFISIPLKLRFNIIRWKYPERVSRIKKLITVATSGFQNSVHTQPVT